MVKDDVDKAQDGAITTGYMDTPSRCKNTNNALMIARKSENESLILIYLTFTEHVIAIKLL